MSGAALSSLFADYRGMADSVADKLVGYSKDDGGWRVAKSNKLVTISWRASTEFPGYLYKGEGLLEMAPDALWEFVKPTPDGLRVKWDRNVRAFQILQLLDEELSVCRTITSSAAMGVISARDFVDVVLVKRDACGPRIVPAPVGLRPWIQSPLRLHVPTRARGAQQDEDGHLLPDGPGWLPAQVPRRLVLPIHNGRVLQ